MAENSKIEWTHHTFNPWSGCTKVSPECEHCYAEVNYSVKMRGVKWGPNGNRVVKSESGWREPGAWNKAAANAGEMRRVFCASLADVFEDWRGPMVDADGYPLRVCGKCAAWSPDGLVCGECDQDGPARDLTMGDVRERLFEVIRITPWLNWLLLTKRPENAAEFVRLATDSIDGVCPGGFFPQDFANVWLGTSVGVRKTLPRIDVLRTIPAVVRFLSIEPLLEDLGPIDLAGIDWVIVGGESGSGARPMHPDWARSIRDQCQAAGVAFHFKQWGEWAPNEVAAAPAAPWSPIGAGRWQDIKIADGEVMLKIGKKAAGRLLDGREWNEYPSPRAS